MLPNATDRALLAIHAPRGNARQRPFTICLAVVAKDERARFRASWPSLPHPPEPYVDNGGPGWHAEIGSVIPGRVGLWWPVVAGDVRAIGRDVAAAIEEYALPALKQRIATSG
jgi:hypothetical protein